MRPPDASKSSRPSPALRWAAIFAALGVWILGLLAASPLLHSSLHSGADHQDHSCAITLFSHGVDDTTGGTFVTSAPMLFPAGDRVIQPALPVAVVSYRFPPGRGPPLC